MSPYDRLISLLLLSLMTACAPHGQPSGAPTDTPGSVSPRAVVPGVNSFDLDELSGRGCGMILRRAESEPRQGYVRRDSPYPAKSRRHR
ncbi:hypothetical protein XM38_013550 [Halomicronema hongdechloris C2206]|uniref:Uncharacterized protein n=1 Tax=Halomicronema hongdechloris C2206 TaxID=1641165 RepID=A0A1Z3HJG9_9CYAN|nr:hypothetical protein XM38_013550 [Halomicronema hongdechloris C2206]